MAEASCSGGTPFKRLIDHQNRDVSHHQDRLVNGPVSQQQGAFRSVQAHQQAQNGFNSFMDRNTPLPGMPLQQPEITIQQHHAASRLHSHAVALEPVHPVSQQAPNMTNWASDFARFSTTKHGPSQQAPQLNHQRSQTFGAPQLSHQHSQNFQAPRMNFHATFAQPNAGFSPLYGPTNGGFMDANAASAQRPAAEADFDEEMSRWMAANGAAVQSKAMEDVDAVMDQMARELELHDPVTVEPVVESPVQENLADLENTRTEQTEIVESPVDQPKERSEVSEAAERLLESVQHEEGEKWKNSVFLSLMRDFRDGRKDIIDNEVRGMESTSPSTEKGTEKGEYVA